MPSRRVFREESAPPVVLAVPGYINVDGIEGRRLADFQVLWNDDPNCRLRHRGWAAEACGPQKCIRTTLQRWMGNCALVATGARAQRMVSLADKARSSVLRTSLLVLLQGGEEKLNLKDKRADPRCERFDRLVDQRFLAAPWEVSELGEDSADDNWRAILRELVTEAFEEAVASCPLPSVRRYKAVANAENMLRGLVRKHLASLLDTDKEVHNG